MDLDLIQHLVIVCVGFVPVVRLVGVDLLDLEYKVRSRIENGFELSYLTLDESDDCVMAVDSRTDSLPDWRMAVEWCSHCQSHWFSVEYGTVRRDSRLE